MNNFPVPQEAVEAGLLNAINGDMQRWIAVSGFTSEDFSVHRDIFQFHRTYLAQYGSLPSASQISTRFSWQPPIGDFDYWHSEMRRYSLARKILEAIKDGYDKVSNPEQALSDLLSKLSTIKASETTHIQATDATANERLEKFDLRTEYIFNQNEIIGMPTGLKILDNTKVGYIPGSLVGMLARPGVGKTWWLLWTGLQAWLTGKTILALTPEMPATYLNLRIDCVAGALLKHPFDYTKVQLGDPSIRENYRIVTEVMSQTQRWWTYDSSEGHQFEVADIDALIKQHSPDEVLIDNFSSLRSTHRGQRWEQVQDICYSLKNVATVREVPIIVTHHAVNSARGRRTERTQMLRGDDELMPSLNDAADGDSFVRVCSDVFTMCGEPTSQMVNWYSIRKTRERGFAADLAPRFGLAVNFAQGKIYDVSQHGYNPVAVGEEANRLLG